MVDGTTDIAEQVNTQISSQLCAKQRCIG